MSGRLPTRTIRRAFGGVYCKGATRDCRRFRLAVTHGCATVSGFSRWEFPSAPANLMRPRRYSVLIADRQSGAMRRLTISLRPTLAVVAALFALPVLIGLGARW